MKTPLIIFFSLITSLLQAQDVTGIWRGHFRSGGRSFDILNYEDRYRFEVQIEQNNKLVNGVTYSYHSTDFYAKAAAKGNVNPKNGKVILQELRIIEVRKASNTFVCAMTCYLTYSKTGNEEFLEGNYTAMNVTDSSFCGKGTVFLRRVVTSDFYKEPFLVKKEKEAQKKKQQIAANTKPPVSLPTTPPKNNTTKTTPPAPTVKKPAVVSTKPKAIPEKKPAVVSTKPKPVPEKKLEGKNLPEISGTTPEKKPISIKKPESALIPSVLKNRDNEVVKSFTLNNQDVTVQLYDNGTIDKDTVSVYLDNKLIISKQMLTTRPITFSFTMDEDNKYHELVMVAENLGEIPPNTSLMVVKSGDKQFEVRITSTEQKNAVVIFKFEKPGTH